MGSTLPRTIKLLLKSTCNVNLLSKLSIIFKEWSYCSLCTFKVPQGANNLILCTLDTIHRLVFVIRLIINTINEVQWVDCMFENVLVSLHSLKAMGLGPFGASAPLFLRNGELLGHSPIHIIVDTFISLLVEGTIDNE